jgi:hypothetical protein
LTERMDVAEVGDGHLAAQQHFAADDIADTVPG